MKIEVLKATADPLEAVSVVAGMSYGKSDIDANRAVRCFMREHDGVYEHIEFTVRISGVSRCLTHQLVRHRLASFVEMSQRYVKLKLDEMADWYVLPETVANSQKSNRAKHHALDSMCLYLDLLNDGVPAEDARYFLIQGVKTNVCMTMNARELFHFLDLRIDKSAQWEIRELCVELIKALKASGWSEIIELWERGR